MIWTDGKNKNYQVGLNVSEKGNARQGFFEKADFDEMVKHLPDYLKGFAKFAYYSGCRRGEVRSLQWADVDLAAR